MYKYPQLLKQHLKQPNKIHKKRVVAIFYQNTHVHVYIHNVEYIQNTYKRECGGTVKHVHNCVHVHMYVQRRTIDLVEYPDTMSTVYKLKSIPQLLNHHNINLQCEFTPCTCTCTVYKHFKLQN